jgi:hypothetical protein
VSRSWPPRRGRRLRSRRMRSATPNLDPAPARQVRRLSRMTEGTRTRPASRTYDKGGESRRADRVLHRLRCRPTRGADRGHLRRVRPDRPRAHQLAASLGRVRGRRRRHRQRGRLPAGQKGKPFQDLETRCLIVSAIRGVDYAVPFEIDGDLTVQEALRRLRPDVFTKGGDRADAQTIAEWDVCQSLASRSSPASARANGGPPAGSWTHGRERLHDIAPPADSVGAARVLE